MDNQTAIVKKVREIFNPNEPMYIPDIQRDYAWDRDEIQALWKDITDLININGTQPTAIHFMGVIVMYIEDSKKWVLDGQQRLTTLYMMLDLLSKKIKDISENKLSSEQKNDNKLEGKIQNNMATIGLLKGYDPIGTKSQRSIILNQRNNTFFNNLLDGKPSAPEQVATNKKLSVAYKCITDLINNVVRENELEDDFVNQLEFLYTYELTIKEKMEFISFIASSETSANQIFECLNARGKDLDASDLIKNYFACGSTKEQAEEWMNYMKTIMGLDSSELSRFIKYYNNSRWSFTVQSDLYSKIKETIEDGNITIEKMIEDQKYLAGIFAAFTTANTAAYKDQEMLIFIEYTKYLGVTTFIPVMLAMRYQMIYYNTFNEIDERNVLEAIITYIFRNVILIGSGAGANKVEKEMARIACEISQGKLRTSREIIEILVKNDRREDSDIINDFRKFCSNKNNVLRYILLNLERHENGRQGYNQTIITSQINIEHIYPKNPKKDEWPVLSEEDKTLIYSIGNVTLWAAAINKSLKNVGFKDKCKEYENSTFKITKDIPDKYTSWGPKEIKERQAYFASKAPEIWKYRI